MYHIQRGTQEVRDFKNGIDGLVNLHYMGSSEFEWGALPQSLKKIRANMSNYVLSVISHNGIEIVLCCPDENRDKTVECLHRLAKLDIRTKEFHGYDDAINGKDSHHKTNFWWDIDTDIMWWVNDSKFTSAFMNALANKPKKAKPKSKLAKQKEKFLNLFKI